jgi:putative FmdB family regulatory protein
LYLLEVKNLPIYEYRCESCGSELEKLQKLSDSALKDCPDCGESALVKMISASSFRLKGTGWYETDFKTGNKKNGVADSKAESTRLESKSDKSSSSSDSVSTTGSTTSKSESSSSQNKTASKSS